MLGFYPALLIREKSRAGGRGGKIRGSTFFEVQWEFLEALNTILHRSLCLCYLNIIRCLFKRNLFGTITDSKAFSYGVSWTFRRVLVSQLVVSKTASLLNISYAMETASNPRKRRVDLFFISI